MILNERIRQLRVKNKLTAKDLSRVFGISESSVSLYESGKRTPNIDLIIKLSNYFNVSTDYLLGITDIPIPYCNQDNIDLAKYIEKILYALDNNDVFLFEGKIMDNKFKILYKKALLNFMDTIRVFYDYQRYYN